MKIVQINATCGVGSTGKICLSISKELSEKGIENYIIYNGKESKYSLGIKGATSRYIKFQALKSKILGNYGFNSKLVTKKIINKLDIINPDIVHLHNIHGHDCNLKILFDYLRDKSIKVVWTFHDCWAFTGYCPHFTMVCCEKWKTRCFGCAQYREYSWLFDRSSTLYEKKKNIFSNLDLTIITPSNWLKDTVKRSFLKEYRVDVINNGIDLNVFNYSKEERGYGRKKHILGVAMGWNNRKGLDVFVELAKSLDDRKYQITLVGTDENVDKSLPKNIISIHRTQNQQELAEIYANSDVFVNPTREDTFPTVNIEALACGTPVITFNSGGSPEIIDSTCGSVIEYNDINSLEKEIIRVCEEVPYSKEACRKRAELFDRSEKFKEYIELYNEVLNDRITKNRV